MLWVTQLGFLPARLRAPATLPPGAWHSDPVTLTEVGRTRRPPCCQAREVLCRLEGCPGNVREHAEIWRVPLLFCMGLGCSQRNRPATCPHTRSSQPRSLRVWLQHPSEWEGGKPWVQGRHRTSRTGRRLASSDTGRPHSQARCSPAPGLWPRAPQLSWAAALSSCH